MGISLDLETSIALACAAGLSFILCLVAYALSEGGGGRRFKRRLAGIHDRAQGVISVDAVVTRSLARQQSATPKIDRIARQWLPRRDMLAHRLARTGRRISVGQYAMTNLGVALLVAITLACTAPVGVVASLLVGLLIGTALPHMAVARMGKRRVAGFVRLFPEAIDLMVRALRSGLPISEAIIGAGREIGDPVGDELGRVEAGMRWAAISKACCGTSPTVSMCRNFASSSSRSAFSARPAATLPKPSPILPTCCAGAGRCAPRCAPCRAKRGRQRRFWPACRSSSL